MREGEAGKKLCPWKLGIPKPKQESLFEVSIWECSGSNCMAWELLEGGQGFCKLIESRDRGSSLTERDDF
jgi:hypothetical protein